MHAQCQSLTSTVQSHVSPCINKRVFLGPPTVIDLYLVLTSNRAPNQTSYPVRIKRILDISVVSSESKALYRQFCGHHAHDGVNKRAVANMSLGGDCGLDGLCGINRYTRPVPYTRPVNHTGILLNFRLLRSPLPFARMTMSVFDHHHSPTLVRA